MTSLKQKLNELIQERKEISRRELFELLDNRYFGKLFEYSCAERRIRQSPDIEALDEDGRPARETNKPITLYRWRGKKQTIQRWVQDPNNRERMIEIPLNL